MMIIYRYIVRLLLMRGERNIRILDLRPPSDTSLRSHPNVTFARTDITDINSVREALTAPFPFTSKPPSVIFHAASIIRFWERLSYSWPITYDVNIRGTENVLDVAANDLGETIIVYTSTSDVSIPNPRFMRLWFDYPTKPWDKVVISDDDEPLRAFEASESNYTKSKIIAERLVLDANGKNGLRTGVLRPG
jgi:nucleoside-diphosphate-sugar epimerase